MQMKKFYFMILFGAIAFGGFAFAGKMPAWVNTPTKVFPADKYFAQVGSGSSKKKAELDAVENLAAIFGREINSRNSSSRRMTQAQQKGAVVTSSDSNFSQDIKQKVSQDGLFGIELKETYFDGKTYYALAVMDKSKTSAALVSMIQKNDSAASEILKSVENEKVSFETIGSLSFAREIARLNEKYLSKLDVLSPLSAADLRKTCVDSKSVSQRISEFAKEIPVYMKIENDWDGQVKQAFSQMLAASGFRTSENPRERYVLAVEVTITRRTPKDGKTVQAYYNLEGSLFDTEYGQNLWPISLNGRESSVDETDLVLRTYRTIASKIKTTVNVSFLNFLNSL